VGVFRSSAARGRDDGEGRIWGAIVDRVLARPALSAAIFAGVLLVLRRAACNCGSPRRDPTRSPTRSA
jgi:hypothetical protein